MFFYELIEQCNRDKLIKEFLRLCDNKDGVEDSFAEFLDLLKSVKPNKSDDIVILGINYFNADNSTYVVVLAYSKAALKDGFKRCEQYDSVTDTDSLTDDKIAELLKAPYTDLGYEFILNNWRDTLGYEIDTDNTLKIGITEFTAAVLYEMTFFGYDEYAIEAKRNELYNYDGNDYNVEDDTEEDDEKINISDFTDTRTDEEKRTEYLADVKSGISCYHTVRDYCIKQG